MTVALAHKSRRNNRVPGELTLFFTRIVLFWEQFWPAILPALAIPFTILIFSLFGLWRFVPPWLHASVLILGAAAFFTKAWRDLRAVRMPSRRDAQARLEADGRVRHAPLQALDDVPFTPSEAASPLWRAHLAASRTRAREARLAGVRATTDDRDPYALRYTAIGLLAVALVAAGDEWRSRLVAGVTPGASGAYGNLVADVWIEPPAYTGKAPIYLLNADQEAKPVADQVNAPQGSVLVAQINGRGRPQLSFSMRTKDYNAEFSRSNSASRAEIRLDESGLLRLNMNGREARWPIGVIKDAAPLVGFVEGPDVTEDARLSFTVATEDDYGVARAQLVMRLDPDQERPLDAPEFDAAALGDVRVIDLSDFAGASGERAAVLDLQSDPWAGLVVLAKVVVADGAGQTGETEEASTTLPRRRFFNPLAKAVLEQRQTLSVAAKDWRRVGRSFDALTMAPEVFFDNTSDYLLLRTAFWRVMRQNGQSFADAVEKFWPLALQLEDEALELARQRLEAAQEALREALERGASDEEIERLVEELRQAMNDYLQALAQSGQATDQSMAQNAQQLDRSDLDDMLNSIRDLAQSGAANAARQMLSDLENMLNNLRLTQSGQGQGGQGQGAGGENEGGAAGEAGDLIGRQRELADEAFDRRRDADANGDDLAAREGALGGDLDDLIDDLQGGGREADPNGDASRALGEARNDMRQAEQALRNGDFEAAGDAMERAIANLRDGAEELAREQMRQAQEGRGGEGRARGDTDPLGRPSGRASGGVEVPGESPAGRTRAVIEELRRRLGEQGRSDEEVEYLERLLERF